MDSKADCQQHAGGRGETETWLWESFLLGNVIFSVMRCLYNSRRNNEKVAGNFVVNWEGKGSLEPANCWNISLNIYHQFKIISIWFILLVLLVLLFH